MTSPTYIEVVVPPPASAIEIVVPPATPAVVEISTVENAFYIGPNPPSNTSLIWIDTS